MKTKEVPFAEAVAAAADKLADALRRESDSLRIDWLESHNARLQFAADDEASVPRAVVYLPTLDGDEGFWREVGRGDDFREAIDNAITSLAKSAVSHTRRTKPRLN